MRRMLVDGLLKPGAAGPSRLLIGHRNLLDHLLGATEAPSGEVPALGQLGKPTVAGLNSLPQALRCHTPADSSHGAGG